MEGGEGVPGVWDVGGSREGYTGYYPVPSQYPHLTIFQPQSPTHGQMKAISKVSMRFPRMGLDRVQIWSRIDLRINPQTGPEMTSESTLRLVPR